MLAQGGGGEGREGLAGLFLAPNAPNKKGFLIFSLMMVSWCMGGCPLG